ncbi:MAG: aldehyde ferredoxin oxidoreductase family protein [Desulfurococcaceae archaeon]
MFEGYMGKILFIDLSDQKTKLLNLPQDISELYIGGSGFAAKVLYDALKPEDDALSPNNMLVIMTGPMTGTPFPTSGRYAICAKSPLTDGWGEATASGFWGVELKKAGFDGIMITGSARKPVYLIIDEGEVNILNADHLWGKGTYEVFDMVKHDHGKEFKALAIGPAGENLVRFAAIIADDERAAARTGLGAVMGSKNLKAIVVRGSKEIKIAQRRELLEISKEVLNLIQKSPRAENLRKYGTASLVDICASLGDLPTKYWSKGEFPGYEQISGVTMTKKLLKGTKACFMCPIACGRNIEVKEGPYAPIRGKGPEYETIAAFGSLNLIDSLEAISKANYLCNYYGMDTVSTGSVIAFTLDLYERGLLRNLVKDFKPEWGNPETVFKLIDMIAKRRGLGDLLAEGVRKFAKKIGGEAIELAVHIRGLDVPMHDPRAFASLGLQYVTMPKGADHSAFAYNIERGASIPELGLEPMDRFELSEKKVLLVKTMQDYMQLFDSLALCKFLATSGVPPSLVVKGFNAVTGRNLTLLSLLEIGERIFNIKRLFNVKHGIGTREYDKLPKKLTIPLTEGGAKGFIPDIDKLLPAYYEARGWDERGIPSKKTLERLKISSYDSV